MNDKLTNEEIMVLVSLICSEQTSMIVKNHGSFVSNEYKNLEALKIKIKSFREEDE